MQKRVSGIDLGTRYRPLRLLGRGGAGAVYLARDLHLGREVALKLLRAGAGEGEELEELRREFTLLCAIEHPGIARAHDFGFLGGRPYFTSEFIPGESAATRAGRLGPDALLRIAVDLAAALAFLHRGAIHHLDVKPANVILRSAAETNGTARETPGRAVLIDFGLHRRGLPESAGARVKGSLPYMAPEYFRRGAIGAWTDVYALGATLYHLATGRNPRGGGGSLTGPGSDPEAWRRELTPPSHFQPGLPPGLDPVILKCLSLDPAARFPSAEEVLEAVAHLQRGGASPEVHSTPGTNLVGRDAELAAVDRFLESLAGGRPERPAILVTGAPGAGLSRFLKELKVRAQTRGLAAYLETGYAGRSGPPGSLLRCLATHCSRWARFLAGLSRPRSAIRGEAPEAERRARRAAEAALALGALGEPLLLIVDGLQHCDEISVALVADLVRYLGSMEASRRPRLGLVLGLRNEGPLSPVLEELEGEINGGSRGEVVTLRPLGVEETGELYRHFAGRASPGATKSALGLFQETAGLPARIAALALESGAAAPAFAPEGEQAGRRPTRPAPPAGPRPPAGPASGDRGRLLHLVLGCLDRPASSGELAALSGLGRREADRILRALEVRGLVCREEEAPEGRRWSRLLPSLHLEQEAPPEEICRLRGKIARGLERLARGREGADLLEAVLQSRLAGDARAVARLGFRAAHSLAATSQDRAALDLFRSTIGALPARDAERRVEASLAMAAVHARLGNLDEGIRLLGGLLARPEALPRAARLRALLRLATLHSRRGEFERADALFREGLPPARTSLGLDQFLEFLNEHAAVKAFRGEHREARRLCEEGLRRLGRARGRRSRELALNLHATLANLSLRSFDYPAAFAGFARALAIAEAIGSLTNRAIILNNLGIAQSQCDRIEEALRSFREAERISSGLDAGPSLVSIRGNRAVLHARRGEFREADDALAAAAAPGLEVWGERQRFFLEHVRGLRFLLEGRFAEALPAFEAAARRGREMGDLHLAAFDEVYRAEARLFTGGLAEAERELRKLAAGAPPLPARAMAAARLGFLGAMSSREEAFREALGARRAASRVQAPPFLEAMDGLFWGWAHALRGEHDAARPLLEAAESYFRRHGLTPALSLANWVQAEERRLAGDRPRAAEILEAMPESRSALTRVLDPLLRAELLLDDGSTAARERARALLDDAAVALAANPLPAWSERLKAVRARVRGPAGPAAAEKRKGRKPAEGAPTRVLTGTVARSALPRLVARSRVMRDLVAQLDRIAQSELPVLITGESGSGKELIARTIHERSRRGAYPFQVVDAAALPAGLAEVELFGARAGAFTDGRTDRPGILAHARNGTVLIDEVAGLTLEVQAKILRAVELGTVRPLGAEREERLDLRFIFTTSRDLPAEVAAGRFRADLLHRLRVLEVQVPPLRDRVEDLPALLEEFFRASGREAPRVEPGFLERLGRRTWPGNVRELRNLVARLSIDAPRRLTAGDLEEPEPERPAPESFPAALLAGDLETLRERLEREYLVHHWKRLKGDTSALCRFLNIARRQLYRRAQRLGISLRRSR